MVVTSFSRSFIIFMSTISLREARKTYFLNNGFAADGGYADTWVPLKFGRLTFYLYNAESRKDAVPFHDLHHIITGYETNPVGEAEIAAWELAAGTWPRFFATFINLSAIVYGAVLFPKRVFNAYLLGCYSKTFYKNTLDDKLLAMTLDEARKQLLPQISPKARPLNFLSFFMLFLASLCFVLTPLILCLIAWYYVF